MLFKQLIIISLLILSIDKSLAQNNKDSVIYNKDFDKMDSLISDAIKNNNYASAKNIVTSTYKMQIRSMQELKINRFITYQNRWKYMSLPLEYFEILAGNQENAKATEVAKAMLEAYPEKITYINLLNSAKKASNSSLVNEYTRQLNNFNQAK